MIPCFLVFTLLYLVFFLIRRFILSLLFKLFSQTYSISFNFRCITAILSETFQYFMILSFQFSDIINPSPYCEFSDAKMINLFLYISFWSIFICNLVSCIQHISSLYVIISLLKNSCLCSSFNPLTLNVPIDSWFLFLLFFMMIYKTLEPVRHFMLSDFVSYII